MMSRQRRKRLLEPEHHDRWAIPYGDLITLLMSFFVVMYALSDISLGKYQVLAQSLRETFRAKQQSSQPVELGDIELYRTEAAALDDRASPQNLDPMPAAEVREPGIDTARRDAMLRAAQVDDDRQGEVQNFVLQLEDSVRSALEGLTDSDDFKLSNKGLWVELEVNTETVFDSASASLSPEAKAFFLQLGQRLASLPVRLRVEGFTDSMPIHNQRFPSNWELSVGRAASLVHVLVDGGVAPDRIAAVGYGATRPVAGNASPEERRKNRRVVLVMLRNVVSKKPFPAIGTEALHHAGGMP